MGLMNVGKSEGSQIIQLFGRGVRLKGYRFSLKRSEGLDEYQKPSDIRKLKPILRHLETLQIFGVQANYMEQFKKFLEEEGLPTNDSSWISIKVPDQNKKVVDENRLQLIRIRDESEFKRNVLFPLELNLKRFDGKIIELDWYPKIDVLQAKRAGVASQKEEQLFIEKHLQLLNWNKLYLEIQHYKDDKGYSNLSMTLEMMRAILKNNSWYKILIPSSKMAFTKFKNPFIWQDLAETLLKRYIEQYYLFEKNDHSADNVEAIFLNGNDDNFIFEYDFQLNSEEDILQYQQKVKTLKEEVLDPKFREIQVAQEVKAFDHILHLYKPLVYVGKNYENLIKVNPIALDRSERQFLDDFVRYVQENVENLNGVEVHILRNQSKKGLGFFTEGNNFYPDFIVWVIRDQKQHIKFVDPKGIRNSRGINDPKIQFHRFLKERIQPQLNGSGLILDSYIVSNTSYLDVQWKENLSIEDFNKENVFFQKENNQTYIADILIGE